MAFLLFALMGLAQPAAAATDLPLAPESVLAGVSFDDKPLILPVQRNFQMAMLTAGSELGRSCGKMEAYGWRMNQSEQGRVDRIFSTMVDRLRDLGYEVEMQSPTSVSRDITMFTADRGNKHLLSMWSAGDIGLVMVLCQTSAPPRGRMAAPPSVQVFPQAVTQSNLEAPRPNAAKPGAASFSPVGSWTGSYVCAQGYTGATLRIEPMHGNNFVGTFHFYPTAKNPSVPEGSYAVYGQYDPELLRILINPGKWLKRPTNYYNTIIVGSFDALADNLSAYFQGINGCTSFEAKRSSAPVSTTTRHKRKPVKHKMKKLVLPPKTADILPAAPAAVPAGSAAAAPSPLSPPLPAQEKAPAAVGAAAPAVEEKAPPPADGVATPSAPDQK
jgi:hypothetical protein